MNNQIGFVTQSAILFSGDIEENIAYGDNNQEKPTKEEIKWAAEIAQASEFIEKLENGYHSCSPRRV